MRTVIVSVIGISSLFLVVLIQKNVTTRMWERDRLEESLTVAMEQTLSEVMEGNHYGIQNRNEMMAAFLQAMIRRMEEDVDLTVKVHKLDYELGQMDVEVLGRISGRGETTRNVSVRRKMVFAN
ncbi:MAG: hypothetical protein MR304_04890 [Eubacterium sp.]|nr:hypothetical protein [Eubacterium sp.]